MTLNWETVKARSISADGKLCCGDCYMAWYLIGTACAKHATAEERAAEDKRIMDLSYAEHPIFKMLRKP